MCVTSKFSIPRYGGACFTGKEEVNRAPNQNAKEEEKTEQENSPL